MIDTGDWLHSKRVLMPPAAVTQIAVTEIGWNVREVRIAGMSRREVERL